MKPESMDAVFHALAHAMRRRILDILKDTPGASVNQVCDHFDVSRIAILKHLNLLEAAGLVVSERIGRVRHLYFNAVPIQLIYDRWTSEYSAFWASQVTDLKYMIETQVSQSSKNQSADRPSDKDDSSKEASEAATSTKKVRKPAARTKQTTDPNAETKRKTSTKRKKATGKPTKSRKRADRDPS